MGTTVEVQTESNFGKNGKNKQDHPKSAEIEQLRRELAKVKSVYGKCAKQLQDEKAVSKALTENLSLAQKERDGMKEQLRNLEELNRDLTFHFQAQSNDEIKDAIKDGTVVNVSPGKSNKSSSRRKRR